jgi:hypothetical protein
LKGLINTLLNSEEFALRFSRQPAPCLCSVLLRVAVEIQPFTASQSSKYAETVFERTVITQVDILLPSCVLAIMEAVPSAIAVIRPVELTVATASLLL